MNRYILTLVYLILVIGFLQKVRAQEKMYIHTRDKVTNGAVIAETDSIYFSEDGSTTFFKIGDTTAIYATAVIDSLTFGENEGDIYITYMGTEVQVINPLAYEGVNVFVNNSKVTVTSTTERQDINYHLSGQTDNGGFKIYSEKRYNLLLDEVSIHNPDGPAINIQSSKKSTVIISSNTENVLSDGTEYSDAVIGPDGEKEDQKATIFSEAKLVFTGDGTLTINSTGNEQHALASDDEIEISAGSIVINSAAKDGIHGKDGVTISGGKIEVSANGDGIDGDEGYVFISGGNIVIEGISPDTKGISADSTIEITGGTLNINVSGNQSKGISCKMDLTMSGGQVTIVNSGDAVLETAGTGFDPSYSTAVKSDMIIKIEGADVNITTTGKGGKSISSDTGIEILSGSVTINNSGAGAKYNNDAGTADAYTATSITSDSYILITGGTITTNNSGMGGKGIKSDGKITIGGGLNEPTINVTTTGTRIQVSGSGNNASYSEAKAISADGDIHIINGDLLISSADDGIKSDSKVTIDDGKVKIIKSVEGIESANIIINGGEIDVTCSDDALNSSTGDGGEGNDGSMITINNGLIVLSTTGGDGLDSNGNIDINGGTTIIHGPQSSPELGIDVNGIMNMNGGFLIASGTNSNMTEGPANSSAQYSILAKSSTSQSSLFHIQDASGNELVTFKPIRNYYSMVFSSSALVSGGSYSIYTGGAHSGISNYGLYSGGTYSGGTLKKTFTMGNKLTNVTF